MSYWKLLYQKLVNTRLENPVRESYRHSIQEELYYRTLNKLKDDPILAEIENFSMLLNPRKPGLEKDLFTHGTREKESVEILRDQMQTGMKVIDIGANIGFYTLIMRQESGEKGKVTAIEPSPRNFELLERNLNLNSFEDVDTVEKAVGKQKGVENLRMAEAPNLNRVNGIEESENTFRVECTTLDSLCTAPDMIRMDVEGYEIEILKGMKRILQQEDFKVFMEIHPWKMEEFYGYEIQELWDILIDQGFRIKYGIRHPNRIKPLNFVSPSYPSKRVINPNQPIEKAKKEYKDFFDWTGAYRVFLEK